MMNLVFQILVLTENTIADKWYRSYYHIKDGQPQTHTFHLPPPPPPKPITAPPSPLTPPTPQPPYPLPPAP